MHEANDVLVGDAYELVAFRDLPRPYQLALGHYMAVDGEAWDLGDEYLDRDPPEDGSSGDVWRLEAALPRLVEEHGDRVFGVATVPMETAKAHVMRGEDIPKGYEWAKYHAWYVEQGDMPDHSRTDRWPCIVSSFGEEAFEDGWHRLHSYARAGDVDLPVVFYPQARHFEAKGMTPPEAEASPSPGVP